MVIQPIKKLGGVDPPIVRQIAAPPGVTLVPATSKVSSVALLDKVTYDCTGGLFKWSARRFLYTKCCGFKSHMVQHFI